MVHGAWSMGHGAWSKGHGARCMERGAWCMGFTFAFASALANLSLNKRINDLVHFSGVFPMRTMRIIGDRVQFALPGIGQIK